MIGSDLSSLQSVYTLRSDSKLTEQWPQFEQYHSSLTHLNPYVHSSVPVPTLPQHDDLNDKWLKQWQDEQLTARLSGLSYAPAQHLSNEHLSLAPVSHAPSYLPQYADLNTNFDKHWQSEQLHAPLTLTHSVASSSSHTSPTNVLTQPYAFEKQIPIIVPGILIQSLVFVI